MKINDVILNTVTQLVVFIILTFGIELFFAGHNSPGGGFVGGLVLSSAIVLLYLVYDIETVHKGIPVDFKMVAAIGVFFVIGTGLGSVLYGEAFLTQTFGYFDLPIVGTRELATVVLFEIGVALTVVGTVVTIILSISEDV